MADNRIVHRYVKSFTSHDGCICCKRILFDGIWEPIVKITLSANTAGAITAEFHAECLRKFLQSGREWGWTPHFKDISTKRHDHFFTKNTVPGDCNTTCYSISSSGTCEESYHNVQRGVFPRSTCLISQTKNDQPAIKFHLTNRRDCIVRLSALEQLLAAPPEPLACNPLKVIISHLFFEKGTLEQCKEKLKFLKVTDKQSAKMFKGVAFIEDCFKQVQAMISTRNIFQALQLFDQRSPLTYSVGEVPFASIVKSILHPTIVDLKYEVVSSLSGFPENKSLSQNTVIKAMQGCWQHCPKIGLKFNNLQDDLLYYGLAGAKVTIEAKDKWFRYNPVIDFLAKGSNCFVNGKCCDSGYLAEGLVSEHFLIRQLAKIFQEKANEN